MHKPQESWTIVAEHMPALHLPASADPLTGAGQLGHGLYSSHHHQQQQHQQQQHRGADAYGYPAAHMGQYGAYGAPEPPQAYDPQRRGPAGGYYQGANGQAPPYKAS